MSNEEIKVFVDMASDLLETRDANNNVMQELSVERADHHSDCLEMQKLRLEIDRLQDEKKDFDTIKQERDSAQSRLYEVVHFLETIWRDYGQINFKDKNDKARAKEMAEKIKQWSDDMKLHAEMRDDGKWYAK